MNPSPALCNKADEQINAVIKEQDALAKSADRCRQQLLITSKLFQIQKPFLVFKGKIAVQS
jgi:hypothetical protein